MPDDGTPTWGTPALGAPDFLALLANATGFEWDQGKASKNWEKHQVSQAECEQVFFNEPLLVAHDAEHSVAEDRGFALGRTMEGRLLLVVFTLRGSLIRIISARPMSRRERQAYVQSQEDSSQG